MTVALFLSVLLIAACGLVYELVASALASYLLGDSVFQFSTVIGAYLFAMGIGSWMSRYIGRGLVARFVTIELMVGVVGGFSSMLLFLAFAYTSAFRLDALRDRRHRRRARRASRCRCLMRILRDRFDFKDVDRERSHVRLPRRARRVAGVSDPPRAASGARPVGAPVRARERRRSPSGPPSCSPRFCRRVARSARRRWRCWRCSALGMAAAGKITDVAEGNIYSDDVIFARDTRYQRIVLTAWKDDLRLFLNSHLQFSSRDEYRYHEALVHPGLSALPAARRVLVLGGGDGLAVREILQVIRTWST